MSDKNNVVVLDEPVAQTPVVAIHPAALINFAMSKADVDLDKLERLFQLQKDYESHEAEKNFHKAMANFRSTCPPIYATKNVSFNTTDYNFAGLAETIEIVKDTMQECGISHSWKTDQVEGGIIKVTCFITHKDGFQTETTLQSVADPSGKKNAIQAIKSTVSYLQRITFFSLLGLAALNEDDDGGSYDKKIPPQIVFVTEEQANILSMLHEQVGGDKTIILDYFKVDDWAQLPSNAFESVKKKLESRAPSND